ncbi:Salutaridinol 7-O-acetyltransferase [Spatholobus suberectus]|nr:Salutaridinol 7-O-acetyltransferase [Spatholobus suberectus]
MKVEVKIISREDIRPSSPTPSHLRVFKLSLLDQLIPSPYAPIILFYTSPNSYTTHLSDVPERLELLKKSLSETLTQFYPLGGKIKEDLSIECNDEGANFVQAQVKCPLDKFLVQPQLTLLHKFLPIDLVSEGSNSGTYVTNIQVNIFECGGIAIGMCISHRILDGAALSTFLKGWTERARGCNQLTQPNFVASSLFPTNNLWLRDLSICMWGSFLNKASGSQGGFCLETQT